MHYYADLGAEDTVWVAVSIRGEIHTDVLCPDIEDYISDCMEELSAEPQYFKITLDWRTVDEPPAEWLESEVNRFETRAAQAMDMMEKLTRLIHGSNTRPTTPASTQVVIKSASDLF